MPLVTRTFVAVGDSVRFTLNVFRGSTDVPFVSMSTTAPCGNFLFSCFEFLSDLEKRATSLS